MQTHTLDFESLSARVAKLEMQNRWWKRGALVFATLASAIFLMGQAQIPHILEANEFVLNDENGHGRARLFLEAGGKPSLSFYDSHGGIVLSLAGGDEPSLTLSRPGSSEQVLLTTNKSFYGLSLYDAQAHRAGLSVQKGVPAFNLFDQDGKDRLSMEIGSKGPAFSLRDSAGKAGLLLTVAPEGPGPYLILFDKDGKVLSSAP